MNLPSIFKSAPVMKHTNQITNTKNDKYDMNVPQQMFGLGIQVFKIQSRKQISNSNPNNAKSLGKPRNQMKIIENPAKRTNVHGMGPVIPKPKKVSALLPSITKTPSEKQYKMEGITKTDSIMSRKSVQKNSNIRQITKMEAIQQYNQPTYTQNRNAPQKNKTFTTTRPTNKSMDAVPQIDPSTSSLSLVKPIYKQQWRPSLNIVRKFLTESNEYAANQCTKIGRKKNQQYLGEQESFVEAYITHHKSQILFNSQQEEGPSFDPWSIQKYKIGDQCGFQNLNYEDHIFS